MSGIRGRHPIFAGFPPMHAPDKHMDEIEPGLWLGNIFASRSVRTLHEEGITHLLSAMIDPGVPPPGLEDTIRLHILVDDYADEDILCHFAETNKFIAEALSEREEQQVHGTDSDPDSAPTKPKGGVLVHCALGASRSATIVAAYLMQKNKLSAAAAVDNLISIRSIVSPNDGFMRQLEIYEEAEYDIEQHPDDYLEWKSKRDEIYRQAVEKVLKS